MDGLREQAMEEIIKQMVQNQIQTLFDDHRDTISKIVKKSIMPQLYQMIQDEISKQFLEMTQNPSLTPDPVMEPDGFLTVEAKKEDYQNSKQGVFSEQGKYLYCIVKHTNNENFSQIGIDGNKVYPICHKTLCAIIHDCKATPYQSSEEKVVNQWIMTHQKVVEKAWETYGVAVPASFDTIIAGDTEYTGDENLKKWLESHYDDLLVKLEKFTGKAEYGIQVFWDANQMGAKISQENEQIKKINEECQDKSKGAAYMYRKKLENILKKELENQAEFYFKEFYSKIKAHVEDIKIEKTKNNTSEQQMIMNIACIMPRANSHLLGDTLEKIDQMEAFSVRFTGPWPPYSFV